MSEFIDKIAAAIAGELYGDEETWRKAAMAVIAAMEQPSEKMIDAGNAIDDAGCPSDGDFGSVGTAEEHWRAMITAELKPD